MKRRIFLLTVILCVVFASCAKREKKETTGNKAKSKITNVSNPDGPPNGIREYILEVETVIGDQENDNYFFSAVADIEVDRDNNIYILERKNGKEVRVFSKNGRFMNKFAREGQGPGELMRPRGFVIDDTNKMVHISDRGNKKISRYFLNGTLSADLGIQDHTPGDLFWASQDHYFIKSEPVNSENENYYKYFQILKVDMEGRVVNRSRLLLEGKLKSIHAGESSGKLYTFVLPMPYRPQGYLCYNNLTGCFYYGYSDKYAITVLNEEFKETLIIKKKNAQKLKVTKEDKRRYMEEHLREGQRKRKLQAYQLVVDHFEYPEYHPFFTGLWVNDKGEILVRTVSVDDKIHIDVFSGKGSYIRKMVIHKPVDVVYRDSIFNTTTIFKGENIYACLNKEDNLRVIKYRLLELKK